MIVLDTYFSSLVFRRSQTAGDSAAARALFEQLINNETPLAVPAIVVPELLSRVRHERQFDQLQTSLEGLQILPAALDHHVMAARITNQCLAAGVTPSTIDALIAAQTIASGGALLSYDEDFGRMASHCGLQLHDFGEETQGCR